MKHLYTEKRDLSDHTIRNLYGFIFEQKVFLSGFRGSIAHGLTIKPEEDKLFGIDDEDTFTVYVYPYEYYLSLESYYHRGEVKETKIMPKDDVAYEVRKTFHLLSACNPNVMTYLYNKPEHYFTISEGGKLILKNRSIFLAKRRIRDAYCGYAYFQLQKFTYGAYKGYMGKKRRKIVDEMGYDTKNAMTLIRLLRNGRELLSTGEMQVYREEDRDFLLDVKRGKYQLGEIQKFADEEFRLTEEAYKNSKLPDENNRNRITELLLDVINIENNFSLKQ